MCILFLFATFFNVNKTKRMSYNGFISNVYLCTIVVVRYAVLVQTQAGF